MEGFGGLLAAVVEDEAEVDRDVEVDAEDVGLEGGAEADGGLEVEDPVDERAALAGLFGELADTEGEEAVEHVGARRQLQRVHRALPAGGRPRIRRHRGGAVGRAAGRGGAEEVEQQEQGGCGGPGAGGLI